MFIKFTCSGSQFESLVSLLIFCLIESKSVCIWVLGSLALVVALILLPLYFVSLKSILSDTRIATPAFYLFIFALHLVGKSFSIPLFWVFVYPCMWSGSGYSTLMGFGFLSNLPVCVFWLVHLVHLHLGLVLLCVNLILPFWC